MARQTFELSHEISGGALVVRVQGKFDREAASAVEALLGSHQGVRVVTMRDVTYISSSGIAALVKLSSSAGIRLAAPAECVRHSLSLAGIERILSIHPDEASARGDG